MKIKLLTICLTAASALTGLPAQAQNLKVKNVVSLVYDD